MKFPKIKPGRAMLTEERAAKRQARQSSEKSEKAKVRQRDKFCRWPRCGCRNKGYTLEVAHINGKGMGGDHGRRSDARNMVLLCRPKHQGPHSLHSGDLQITTNGKDGADGPLTFWQKVEYPAGSTDWPIPTYAWVIVAEESSPHVLTRD